VEHVDHPPSWYAARGRRTREQQIAHEAAAALLRRSQRIDSAAVLARDQHRCRYCGAAERPLAVDHLLPISRGGCAEIDNLVAACKPCNSRKKNRTPEEAGMALLPIVGEQVA
jgi:5-methylcytosine-specific restriction endonuclease McrA